jgi:signal transduction histidine kinase
MALSDLLARAAFVNGWQFTEQLDEAQGLFPPEAENSIFRMVQESLNNISKHAAATFVSVRLVCGHDMLDITVQDNGCGFMPGLAPRGTGLRSIGERAALLGGHLQIESAPGQGTTLHISLPVLGARPPTLD